MMGLLTGHSHLKGHPFKLRLVNSPQCDRQASETALHVCECWTLATLRLGHLAHHFMNPGDFEDICVSKILHIESVGLLHTNTRVAQKPNYGQSAWVTIVPALLLFHQVLLG